MGWDLDPDESGWILSWIGLAIVVVFLDDVGVPVKQVGGKLVRGKSPAGMVARYTLIAVIAYVLLTNAEVFGPPIQRWVARLSARGSLNPAPVRRPPGSPSGPQEF